MWFQCKVVLFLFLLCALIACCSTSRSSAFKALRVSAVDALESSVLDMGTRGRFDVSDEESEETEDDEEVEPVRISSPVPTVLRREARPAKLAPGKRQRVTPFQAKRIAAAQGWRCGCGCVDPADPQRRGYVLDANFEIDHRIPTRWGGAHDQSNWVAVLRSHHQVKSARESSEDARRRR